MKTQHRHELKTNELAEFIANLPNWIKENAKMIIYVSVVVILVGASYIYHNYQKNVVAVQRQTQLTQLTNMMSRGKPQIIQALAQNIDVSYKLIQTADDFTTIAQDLKQDLPTALALIKRAEAIRMELHYRPEVVTKDDIQTRLSLAKAACNEALEKSVDSPALTAMAKLGLGQCEEELGNLDQAIQIYNEIIISSELEGTVAVAQAKMRLDSISDYSNEGEPKGTDQTNQ